MMTCPQISIDLTTFGLFSLFIASKLSSLKQLYTDSPLLGVTSRSTETSLAFRFTENLLHCKMFIFVTHILILDKLIFFFLCNVNLFPSFLQFCTSPLHDNWREYYIILTSNMHAKDDVHS